MSSISILCLFFFNDTATTEIYTLSLHDALPISELQADGDAALLPMFEAAGGDLHAGVGGQGRRVDDRSKSTRLNSNHTSISYAVLCLEKNIVEDECGFLQ